MRLLDFCCLNYCWGFCLRLWSRAPGPAGDSEHKSWQHISRTVPAAAVSQGGSWVGLYRTRTRIARHTFKAFLLFLKPKHIYFRLSKKSNLITVRYHCWMSSISLVRICLDVQVLCFWQRKLIICINRLKRAERLSGVDAWCRVKSIGETYALCIINCTDRL